MLQILEDILINNNLFIEVSSGNLKHSSCPSTTINVLDFEEIKKKFCDKIGLPNAQCCSCDALLISKKKDEMNLIEMKRISANITDECFIEQQGPIIANQFIDSILLILSLVGYYKIDEQFYSYFFNRARFKKKYWLLSNFSNDQLITSTLINFNRLGIAVATKGFYKEEIGIISCETFNTQFASVA